MMTSITSRGRHDGVATRCGPDCRHAEPLRWPYGEWVWCHRRDAAQRLHHEGSWCSHHVAGLHDDRALGELRWGVPKLESS